MISCYAIHLVGNDDDENEYRIIDQANRDKLPKIYSSAEIMALDVITVDGEDAYFFNYIDMKNFIEKHSIEILSTFTHFYKSL